MSREPERRLDDTLRALRREGLDEVEVHVKRGRSRRLSLGVNGRWASYHQEKGWAVRGTTERASFFACGSGDLEPGGPWPEPDGRPLRLPAPEAAGAQGSWSEPSDFETPLLGETEGLRLLTAMRDGLAEELPAARLTSLLLEDGSSDSELRSSLGVEARWRRRLATLRAEAVVDTAEAGSVTATVELAAREGRSFGPAAVARRLADRLAAAGGGVPDDFPRRDRGEFLLAPALAARLLVALAPWWLGPGAAARAAALTDRRGRVASEAVTLVDDGRLSGGVLEAPVDGEGLATRRVVLIDGGVYRQPLLDWRGVREIEGGGRTGLSTIASGCARRASWRDVPEPGPTHLYLAPAEGVSVASMLRDVARGYYLLAATGDVRVEADPAAPAEATFRVPVCGFAMQGGRARRAVSGVDLRGGVGALLRGVQTVGRDLSFFPYDGMVGAPTVRVAGLELVRRADRVRDLLGSLEGGTPDLAEDHSRRVRESLRGDS